MSNNMSECVSISFKIDNRTCTVRLPMPDCVPRKAGPNCLRVVNFWYKDDRVTNEDCTIEFSHGEPGYFWTDEDDEDKDDYPHNILLEFNTHWNCWCRDRDPCGCGCDDRHDGWSSYENGWSSC